MGLLFASGVAASLIPVGLVLVSFSLGSKYQSGREVSSPFECGFDPFGKGRKIFSTRFFLVAVIFLIFDVEIALLLPLMTSLPSSLLSVWTFLSLGFVVILLLGVYFEWNEGALDWKS